MQYLSRFFFSLIFLSFLAGVASGQEGTDRPAAEASPYLLDFKLGDSAVGLILDGYWRMGLVAGGSFGIQGDGNRFSGLAQGVNFFQEPDLIITLWLNKRWFLETTFLEGFERNTYRAGYQGQDDEFVREVVVGNAGVNAGSYAGVAVPKPRQNTPGIVAKFGTEQSNHELLLRYDPTETGSTVFQGSHRVKTQDINLSDFIEGQYFILPDTGVDKVSVYLENKQGSITGTDADGSTRRYRAAEPVEYFVDGAKGLLELEKPHDGRVAVYYEVGGKAVGDPDMGRNFIVPKDVDFNPDLAAWNNSNSLLDFSFGEDDVYDLGGRTYNDTSRVDIAGRDSLILYEPGRFTPFERQNVYASSMALPKETWRVSILIRERGSLYPETPALNFGFVPDNDGRTIAAYGAVGSKDGLRNPANRYPFAVGDPGIYGPGRETDEGKISRTMVAAVKQNSSGYSLGTGVVPGSVVVHINGVRDDTVEIVDGQLNFKRFIYIDDWIEVNYRTEILDLEGGDIYIYQGNRFDITPQLRWEIAESFRWNLNKDRTVEEYKQSPGEIAVVTTLDWETDRAGISLSGSGSLSTPDTAGNFRLFGMDQGGTVLGFFDSTLVAAPSTLPGAYQLGKRQNADRYSYKAVDAFGNAFLNDYLWDGASSTGKDGPGLAGGRSGDPIAGSVMDLRFDMEADAWTAGDFLADSGGSINLSGYTAVEFPIMFRNDYGKHTTWSEDGTPEVIFQAGEIGESADHHNDGVVNTVDVGAMAEWILNTEAVAEAWSNPGRWETIRIPISPGDRAKLASVRAFRLVVVNKGDAMSGRLIVGPPRFDGSPFRTEIRSAVGSLAANQWVSGDTQVDNTLKSAYPETAELFHSGGEDNRAMRLRWGKDVDDKAATVDTERWEAVSWFDGVPMGAYRTMVFFVKVDQENIGLLTAKISDRNGKGITVSWTPTPKNIWDRITVDLARGSAVSAQGAAIKSVTVDADAGELTRMLFTGADKKGDASSSEDSGTLYIDEIYFKDPSFSITGGAEITADWRYEDDIATLGGFTILGDIEFEGRVEATGGTMLSGITESSGSINGDVDVGVDLLGVGLQTEWGVNWDPNETNWSGSHKLRIPAQWDFFWLDEAYSRSRSGTTITFSRENGVNLRFTPGSLRGYSNAAHNGTSLVQSWGGETQWSGEHWRTDLKVRYALSSTGISSGEANYFGSWIRDYAYLAPAGGNVTSREAHHEFNSELSWAPFLLKWTPELRIKVFEAPNWNQENRWAGTLALTLRFDTWSLTPSYQRSLRQKINTASSGAGGNNGFDDAWAFFADGIGGQFPLITYVPFREFFGTADGERFAVLTQDYAETDYKTEFAVDITRLPTKSITDLFLPTNADLSIRRDYSRQGDTVGWKNIWSGSLSTRAINLFGRFGRHPLTSLYNTDEISGLVRVELQDYNGTDIPTMEELLWQVDLSFTGNRERKLVLDHRLSWDWEPKRRMTSQEGRIEFHWRSPSKEVLRLPLINRAIPRQHHIENRERIAIRGVYPWATPPSESVFNIGVILRHETLWVFQDTGHLKGWLAFGLGGSDDEFTNAWELGVEAEFRF